MLVRHGETPDNVKKGKAYVDRSGRRFTSRGPVISGHNDVGLTALGALQCIDGADRMVRYLLNRGYPRYSDLSIVCSDLPRAQQTEALFTVGMRDFAPIPAKPLYTPALRERDAGELQGWVRELALRRYPDAIQAFSDHTYRYPGGESLEDCGMRAGEFIVSHVREHGRSLLVFTHEITILGVLDYLANGRVTKHAWGWKEQVPNAGFFDVLFDPDTERGEVVYPVHRS